MITRVDSEILQPLNDSEVVELLELYRKKYGPANFQYLLIYTQCKWNERLKEIHDEDNEERWKSFRKVFYTLRQGDFRKHGTYICLHYDIVQSVSFHSWEPGYCELLYGLGKTQLIQWKNGPLLINVAPEYSEEVKKIAINKGVTIQNARLCQGSILLHEDALKLSVSSVPDGFIVKHLQEDHANLIHSLWANNKEGSREFIKGLMHINKCIGIFEKESNALVGWIFQNEFSGLGILQVLPSVQRNGLGTILAGTLTNLIAASENVNLSAWVVVGNNKSQSLLEKLGYKRSVVHEWIQLNKIK